MARKRGQKERGEIGSKTSWILDFLYRHGNLWTLIVVALLTVVGAYIRLLPGLRYGLELDANDPWIAYWIAEQFHNNGLLAFDSIRGVKEFWWPYGRDFLTQEYIGVSWLAAATYPIGQLLGLTLKEWLALFPVFAGTITIPLAYILVKEATGSRIGGIVSAMIFSLYPGAIVRTTVGFVEKTGIAVPILTLYYILLLRALKEGDERRRLITGVLAGLTGGVISFFWGGFDLALISAGLIMILDPLLFRPSRDRMKLYLALAMSMALVVSVNPAIGPQYLITNIGVVLPLGLVIYLLALHWSTRGLPLLGSYTPKKHLWLVATLVVAGVIVINSGMLHVSGRILMALGVRNLSPLAESVQEHQPLPWNAIFTNYGVPLLVFLLGFIYYLYRVYSGDRRITDIILLPLFTLTLFLVYANKQLAYFTQMASFYVSLGAGLSLGVVSEGAFREVKVKKRRSIERDPIKIMIAGFLLLIIAFSSGYYGYNAYKSNAHKAPMILTGGLGTLTLSTPQGTPRIVVPLNKAWINMLDYIKNNTSKDALIVSWWDYGYWITVNTDRKTLADGATANETQIRLLAQILTGTEGDANYILKNKIGAEPNNTYILFYEVYRGQYDKTQGTVVVFPEPLIRSPRSLGTTFGVITHGAADFAKSFQMLKISYKIPPFTESSLFTAYSTEVVDDFGTKWVHFPGFIGIPEENRTRVLNTLIYKLGMYGLTYLNKRDVVITDNNCQFLANTTLVFPAVIAYQTANGGLKPQMVVPGEPKSFVPEAISVGCPIVSESGNTVTFVSVVVYLYKWTG
ncbi:MAG: hypothetical protein GSR86_04735 [Desulfurococcales archaeon]|nr:hypothetical protein [Desulfurococcales archaeon]